MNTIFYSGELLSECTVQCVFDFFAICSNPSFRGLVVLLLKIHVFFGGYIVNRLVVETWESECKIAVSSFPFFRETNCIIAFLIVFIHTLSMLLFMKLF